MLLMESLECFRLFQRAAILVSSGTISLGPGQIRDTSGRLMKGAETQKLLPWIALGLKSI